MYDYGQSVRAEWHERIAIAERERLAQRVVRVARLSRRAEKLQRRANRAAARARLALARAI